MEDTINGRIDSLINSLRMNKNSFGKFINVSPQNIHNIIGERKSKPSSEILEKIVTAVNSLQSARKLNLEWLLTGKGQMFIDSKPKDNGAFGREVEILLEQLAEKDKQINSLLKIIENNGLGKDEVIDQQAGEYQDRPPIRCKPDAMTEQPPIAA